MKRIIEQAGERRRHRTRTPVRIVGQVRRDRAGLLRTTALQAAFLSLLGGLSHAARAQPAPNAHPTGGQVVAGQASISQGANLTAIDQSSERAAINWQSFDIGSQQTVQFNQPSTSAVTLNRVVTNDPSQIAGHIQANGQVIITNPAGVIFGRGAQVDTAGLVVSAAGITNQNFMAGRMVFDQPGSPNARVENDGTITIKQAGLAALVAPQVANKGVITAKMGRVLLGGAVAQTVDLYGDGLLSIDVSGQVTQAPLGPDGKPVTALVTNTGLIRADGGTVQLTARAVDGIVRNLVTAGGTIHADSIGSHAGTVSVVAIGGDATVTGTIAAAGAAAGTTGGAVEVNATRGATIASTARIDVSGSAGGGLAALGTTLARARSGPSVTPTLTASTTTLASGAVINADATANGRGGSVVLLSQDQTSLSGAITARGGPAGGAGGFVELSSEGSVLLGGTVNAGARDGVSAGGSISLDPVSVEITDGTPNGSYATSFTTAQLLQLLGGGASIGVTATGTSATPQATDGEILIDRLAGPITASALGLLTLQADREIDVETNMSVSGLLAGANVVMTAGNKIYVGAGDTLTSTGNISLAATGAAGALQIDGALSAAAAGTISLAAGTGGILLATVTGNGTGLISAGELTVSTTGTFAQPSAASQNSTLAVGTLAGTAAFANLVSATNSVASLGSITTTGDFNLINLAPLVVGGPLTAADVDLTAFGTGASITIPGTITATGQIFLSATGNITEVTGGTLNAEVTGGLSANTLIASAGNTSTTASATLTGANTITSIGSLAASGDFALADAITGTFTGNVAVGGVLTLTGRRGFAQSAGTIAAATLTGSAGNGDFTGNLLLDGGNSIANLGSFTAHGIGGNGGTYSVGVNAATTVSGVVSANDISLRVQGFTMGAAGSLATPGVLELAPFSNEPMVLGTTAPAGTLAIASTAGLPFGAGDTTPAAILRLGAVADVISAPTAFTPTAESITVAGPFTDQATALELHTTNAGTASGNLAINAALDASGEAVTLFVAGTATETAGGSISAATLSGSVGAAILDNGSGTGPGTGNAVATLGPITAAGLFRFDDTGVVSLGGNISGDDVSLRGTALSFGSFSVTGTQLIELAPLTATQVTLGGGGGFDIPSAGLSLNTPLLRIGAVTSPSSTSAANPATATASSIDIIAADTYTPPSGALGLELDSAGTIGIAGTLGSASATLARLVAGGSGDAILLSSDISLGAAASTIALDTGAGNIVQSNGQLTANTLALNTATGNVNQTGGNLNVNTLTGSVGGTIGLPDGNFIGTIANLAAGSLAAINDESPLTVIGSLTTSAGGSLALTVNADAPSLAIGATGTAATVQAGTVSLAVAGGPITETSPSGITATTLNDGGATASSVTLTGTGNVLTNLGAFASSADFSLTDSNALTVTGLVSATTTLALGTSAGGVVLGVTGTAGVLSSPTVSLAVAGGVTEPNGGVTATILTGSAGALALTSATGNDINTLTAFTTTGDLALTDTAFVALVGTVASGTASSISLSDDAGIAIGTDLFAQVTVIPLPAEVTAGTLSLAAAGGPVSELATSTINATTVDGGGASATSVGLTGINTITNLGAFASSGAFTLDDTAGLTVIGAASAGLANTLTIATGGSLAIGATGLPASLTGGLVSLTATGAITEPNGPISATTLKASAGTITLDNTTNHVSTLASSTGTAGFLLVDASPLIVAGAVAAPSAGNAGLVADSITFTTGASLAANTTNGAIELAPLSTTGTFTLSTIAGTLASLTGNTLRLGAYTASTGRTVTAGTLINDASFTLPSTFKTLEADSRGAIEINAPLALGGTGAIILDAGGAISLASGLTASGGSIALTADTSITQTAGLISTASLSAAAATGSVSLTDANLIATLTAGSAGAGFALTDSETLNLPGALAGGTGPVALTTTGGTLIQAAASSITGGSVALSGPDLALAGTITTAGLTSLAETAPIGTINQTGTLRTGTLSVNASQLLLSTNDASIIGASPTANTITALGASTSNGLTLRSAGDLTVTGLVQTGTDGATLTTTGSLGFATGGTIIATTASLSGTSIAIGAGGALRGSIVSLDATTGGIDIGGALTGTTSVALLAAGAAGSITGTGALAAGLLTGTATGAASLTGSANVITDLGSFSAASVALTDSTALDVTGAVSGGSVALTAPRVTVDASVVAPTVSLDGTGAGIALNGLVSASTVATLAAPGATGTIAGTGTLQAASLTGTAGGAVSLTGPNAVAALGDFTAGGFTLATGTLIEPFAIGALTIDGAVAAPTIAITATDPLAVAATGTVTGAATALTGTSLAITGSVTGSTSLGLTATAGAIIETGSLATALLDVSATGSANLSGAGANANLVAALGTIHANGFTLAAGTSTALAGLAIDGLLNGTSAVSITDTGSLTVAPSATVTAGSITLGAATIALDGLLSTPGALALTATGDISEPAGGSAAITASSLSGSGAVVSLLGATPTSNRIGTIAPTFTATSFTLDDGVALALNGLSATTLGVTATTLDVTGPVAGTDVSLASSTGTLGIDAGGSVTGSHTVTLTSASSLHDDGALLTPGTLSGSAIGSASLLGSSATANAVADLGDFSASGFTLRDATGSGVAGLSVTGTVNGTLAASISETGPLTIASGGLVTATAISLTTIGADLAIAGTATGSTVTLASGGAITEPGAINASSLNGTAAGTASLTGSNAIDTLTSFGASAFTLADGNPLTIAGSLSGGSLAGVTDTAAIDVSAAGQVSAATIGLTGSAISIEGSVLGGATTLDAAAGSITIAGSAAGTTSLALLAPTGAITETGAISAALLTGTASGTASLLGTTNAIGTLGGFTADGLSLLDGATLAIAGQVAGGSFASVSDTSGIALQTGASLTASNVTLTGGGLTLDGTVLGSLSTTLLSTGGIAAPGSIDTSFLTGSATGTAALTGANAIASLGSFSAASLALTAGTLASLGITGLSVTGPVTAAGSASITEAGPLSVATTGSVDADTVSLAATGDSLTIAGAITGTTAITLAAGLAITETGSLSGASLSTSTTGTANLLGASPSANAIGTLASSSADGLLFADGTDLAITGVVGGGTLASIADTGSLTVAAGANLAATAVTLSAGAAGLTIAGLVTGTASTSLFSLGTISETGAPAAGRPAAAGTLLTGSLTGTATGDVSLAEAANQIGTLGAFAAPSLLLDATTGSLASTGLSVSGPVTVATNASIVETGTLAVPGTITATDLALSATGAGLSITGAATGTNTLTLSAHGAITAPGTLTAATLSGSAGSSASLTGTANAIGTLGGFAAPAGLTLLDASGLSVTGPATGSRVALSAPSISVPGSIAGSQVALAATGTDITIGGSVTGSAATTLTAAGAISETGTLATALLTGSAGGAANLPGATPGTNAIGTLGPFSAASLALADGGALTIAGPVAASGDASLASASSIVLTGGLAAATATLAAAGAGISLPGSLGATTSIALSAPGGTIGETGTITTALLTAAARGAIALAGATPTANRIGTLSGLAAASLTLNDGLSLSIAGPASLAGSATILDSGTIGVSGALSASTVSLGASSIAIPGTLTGAGLVTLTTTGTIDETGALNAGTLALTAGGSAQFLGGNLVGTLGNVSAQGFALDNTGDGTISGTLSTGPSLVLDYGGTLSLAPEGSLNATAIGLTAADLVVDGHVTGGTDTLNAVAGGIEIGGALTGTTSVALAAATTITEPGTLVTALLSGSAAGTASLAGASGSANQIGTLASFTAASLALRDGAAMAITGPVTVSGDDAITDAVSLALAGTLSANQATLSAPTITLTGALSVGNGTLSATGGDLVIAGNAAAATSLTLAATGAIGESGTISTPFLLASAGTLADLTGNASNQIGSLTATGADIAVDDRIALTIGTAAASNGVAVTSAGDLTIAGSLQGVTVNLVSGGAISSLGTFIAGTLAASAAGSASFLGVATSIGEMIGVTADGISLVDRQNLTITGTVSSQGPTGASAFAFSGTGNLDIPGTLAGSNLSLSAAGTIGETGALFATSLAGSAGGGATFSGATPTANTVASLGSFSASNLALRTDGALTVAGPLGVPGTTSLQAAGDIAIPGQITTSVLDLVSGGSIDEPGGITAALLEGSTTGSAAFTDFGPFRNTITNLGPFTAGTSLTLNDQSGLGVVGPVSAGTSMTVTTNGTLALGSPVSAPSTVLDAAGDIGESMTTPTAGTLTGVLTTGTLTISSTGGAISLASAANQVSTLVSASSAGSMTLADSVPLSAGAISTGNAPVSLAETGGSIALLGGVNASTLGVTASGAATYAGPLVANTILSSTGGPVTLSGDLVTGGVLRPLGTIAATSLPSLTNSGQGGAYFVVTGGGAFTQLGNTTITPLAGAGSILSITTDGGAVSFGTLNALHTWLLINAGSGHISGNIDVQGIDVGYAVTSAGNASLFGVVDNLTGLGAASAGFIQPQRSNVYRINDCPIQSVNCVLLRPEAVPVVNPVSDLDAGALPPAQDDPDLILPDIGGQGIEVGAGPDDEDERRRRDHDVQTPDIGRRDIPQ